METGILFLLLKEIFKQNTDIMKKLASIIILLIIFETGIFAQGKINSLYITNQAPLLEQTYSALPLGAIKPSGMLQKMLEIQRDGLTGMLDSLYAVVCGENNGWLGGTGDGWERGPYWLDGLVPLAYILDDDKLKEKAQKWIEWSINNQRNDGYFGPVPLPEGFKRIPGTQQTMREDWWPRMVMLKVLQQYYSATEDKRIINLMTRYFRYQLKMLPDNPLGKWSYWANRRGGDNLAIVYWLYNITGEKFLLELAEIIAEQTFNWTEIYSENTIRKINPLPGLHCVNVAQGLKEPMIYYQQSKNPENRDAVKKGLNALKDVHGFVNGMYGGDEQLHGNNPTQGVELCSVIEMMYSFESILPISGDIYFADYLEKLAYNLLPTQINDDFTRKQYFQQPNQVLITDRERNFINDNYGHLVYGTTTGYPCCLTNMHQGWPKFIQNLWYATKNNGIAALVYGASEVTANVGKGETVRISEKTNYPFSEDIVFTIEESSGVKFPFHLRIPLWCENPEILVNGESQNINEENNVVILNRLWKEGDKVSLKLPMNFKFSRWHENSMGIERGPLVYALKVEEEWREITKKGYNDTYWEVYPKSSWNYMIPSRLKTGDIKIEIKDNISDMPWNLDNAPISLKFNASLLPDWKIQDGSASTLNMGMRFNIGPTEEITLIPYGCTTLRISQFPAR